MEHPRQWHVRKEPASQTGHRLSPHDRWELYRWLGESRDVQRFRLEELRRELAVGIEQADRGETAPLNVQNIKDEVRRRLAAKG